MRRSNRDKRSVTLLQVLDAVRTAEKVTGYQIWFEYASHVDAVCVTTYREHYWREYEHEGKHNLYHIVDYADLKTTSAEDMLDAIDKFIEEETE